MSINRRSFLRALGITPAAIVAAKYIPEAAVAAADAPATSVAITSSPIVPADTIYVIPKDAIILRVDESAYHALDIAMASHAPDINVTSYYDSTNEYARGLFPERREVFIKCAGVHQFGQFLEPDKVACSILLRNGGAVDFNAYIMSGDATYTGRGDDFTRLRLAVDGEVTLRRC